MTSRCDLKAQTRRVKAFGDLLTVRFGAEVWFAPHGTRFKEGDRVRCLYAGTAIVVIDTVTADGGAREVWLDHDGRSR